MSGSWVVRTFFAFRLPNRPGELARFAAELDEAGIDLLGLWGYAEGDENPQLSCVPASADGFRAFASEAGIKSEEGRTLYRVGTDERGALKDTLDTIADAGINVDAIECVASGSHFGCFLWAEDEQFERLKNLLTA